tara:strand:+ start:6934 stop:7869 length:936 start_codon:yes stop_codon:yes gene_type:complete
MDLRIQIPLTSSRVHPGVLKTWSGYADILEYTHTWGSEEEKKAFPMDKTKMLGIVRRFNSALLQTGRNVASVHLRNAIAQIRATYVTLIIGKQQDDDDEQAVTYDLYKAGISRIVSAGRSPCVDQSCVTRLQAILRAYATQTDFMTFVEWDFVRRLWILGNLPPKTIVGLNNDTTTFKLASMTGKTARVLEMTDRETLTSDQDTTGFFVYAVAAWHLLRHGYSMADVQIACYNEVFYTTKPVIWIYKGGVGTRATSTMCIADLSGILACICDMISKLQVPELSAYLDGEDHNSITPGCVLDSLVKLTKQYA